MTLKCTTKAKTNARTLRKNQTKEERHLWYDFLNNCQPHFRRQKPVENYIIDFYCPTLKLAIELDGSQHYDIEQEKYDAERTKILNELGIEIMRFSNKEIWENFRAVCEVIENRIKEKSTPLSTAAQPLSP